MDTEVLENKAGDSSKTTSNKRKRRRANKKRMETNGSQIMNQTCANLEVTGETTYCKMVSDDLEKNIPDIDLSVQPLVEYPKTVSGLPEVKTDAKRKKKRKRTKKVKSNNEVLSVDQNKMDVVATGNLAEADVVGKRRKRKRKKKKAKIKNKIQSMDQTGGILNLHLSDGQEVEGMLIENEAKAPESEFSTRKELSQSDSVPDKESLLSLCKDAEPVDLSNAIEVLSNRISSELNEVRSGSSLEPTKVEGRFCPLDTVQQRPCPDHMDGENEISKSGMKEADVECTAKESEFSVGKGSSLSDLVPDKDNLLDSHKDEETIGLSHALEDLSNRVSSELVEVGSGPSEVERKFVPPELQHGTNHNKMAVENEASKSGINELNSEIVVEENSSAEGRNTFSSCNVDVVTHLSPPDVKEAGCISNDLGRYPRIAPPIVCIKRKLLVLDVNGLLAHIVMPPPIDCMADAYILGRAIFKRPYCDDFLKFCFENFDVGIWSSRSKRIIDRVVDYLLDYKRDKLKFCWDMVHSTQTGFRTLENSHKPLVCKELKKIWENEDPNVPWKKGDYDESNTLLLDDSPYKALLNPLHTAIFPHSYQYADQNDNSLGPGGDIRVYLEGLLTSENVQKYVELHPFGQNAINENNLSWGFYSGVLHTMSNRNNSNAIPPLSLL